MRMGTLTSIDFIISFMIWHNGKLNDKLLIVKTKYKLKYKGKNMKFELFDDEFEQEKPEYLKTIYKMADELIEKEKRGEWNLFVSRALINTRSFYIIETALKVMKNLNGGMSLDSCIFKSVSFMPDQSFVEMVVAIVSKYHKIGEEFAKHYSVDLKQFENKK